MSKKFTLILFLLILTAAELSYSLKSYAQPASFEDFGGVLAETIVEPEKPASAPRPKSLAAKPAAKKKIIYNKPVYSKSLTRPTVKEVRKPSSLNKGYAPQMTTKKIITKPVSMNQEVVVKKPVKPIQTDIAAEQPVQEISKSNFRIPLKPSFVMPIYSSNTASLQPKYSGRKPVIVIDPGHGGKDPGATGKLGTREKNITLQYGLALKKVLEQTGKYKVVMTRSDDRFVELGGRVNIARRVGGDVMISIHADSNPNKTTRGFSVYTLSNRRADDEAQKLLARSNREDVVRGANIRNESKDVREAIIDFAQGSTKDVSDDFAKTIAKNLGRRIQALRKQNREGSLAVLTGADIPSVLIELGYLSNEYEERLLRREDHKQKIVNSIANSISEYFSKFKLVF